MAEHSGRNYEMHYFNIRKAQHLRLIALAAQIQSQRGETVSISEVMRDALDFGIAEVESLVAASNGKDKGDV